MKKTVLILSFLLGLLPVSAQTLTSPDGSLVMNFSVDREGRPTCSLRHKGCDV